MSCTSCSSGADGQPKGCKNNGTCGSDGCNKLTVFDWLANMSLPGDQKPFIGVEVRFKNGRKHFYRNTEKLSLSIVSDDNFIILANLKTLRTSSNTLSSPTPTNINFLESHCLHFPSNGSFLAH